MRRGCCAALAAAMLVVGGLVPAARAEPAAGWRLEVSWWNDLFAELPPADDQGFTNDLRLGLLRVGEREILAVGLVHRMLTERFGDRRWDQLELVAAASRSAGYGPLELAATGRAGPSLAGDLGGCAIQNSWHRVTDSGATVDEGLQNRYDGDRRLALLLGASGAARWPLRYGSVRGEVDGQLAAGSTGVSRVAAGVGGELEWSVVRLGLDLALARYHTRDPNLELRGGYRTGSWQLEPRLTIGVELDRYRFGWQYRANESGSGEAVGLFWLAVDLTVAPPAR